MTDIFRRAEQAWNSLAPFRSERTRCKRYVYGDQWDDIIFDGQHFISEGEYIRRMGQIPLKNNILRRILRNVTGLYRAQYRVPLLNGKESELKGSELKEENRRRTLWWKENLMEEFAPRLLEEFLISGIVAVKTQGRRILPVTPDNFFFHSDGFDPRGCDIDLIGEVHEVEFATLLERFCESADDYLRITDIYGGERARSGKSRLLEIWSRETRTYALIHDENQASIRIGALSEIMPEMSRTDQCRIRTVTKSYWMQRWYAHDGTLLREGSPAEMHPYVFKAYPFLDGEVHSYISDVIDQQRYVNRLITLYDFIMKSSAKGVLLFPDESIPKGMSLQDISDEWSRFNGVIPFKAKPGIPLPTQVSGNAANIGITELLKIEMQLLEDISGVSPTLQGKLAANSTSGTLFAQQNEAAQTSLLDILRSFEDFLRQLASRPTPDESA